MYKYIDPKYDEHRALIRKIVKRKDWDFAKYHGCSNKVELQSKLYTLVDDGLYPEDLDANMWIEIWTELKSTAEESQNIIERIKKSTLVASNADNDLHVPNHERSSWTLYKNSLIKNGWTEKSVNELETATEAILKKLNFDTRKTEPIKGLVIGNVQSGKTANMAALMAMAADWGWKMFIVLSGIIENLRIQTENRLIKDLNNPGNLTWKRIPKPSVKGDDADQTHHLHLGDNGQERYLTVCLKNSKRLEDLNLWLKADTNKYKQMRILVIDDEADQAGINTKNVQKEERTKINNEIVKLVNMSDPKPTSMNYISYTATPYANFLNEAKPESLYPRDFIGVLNPAKEYFGPKQIFGLEESEEFRGLRCVREIVKNNINDQENHIKEVHKGKRNDIPESLKEAIKWFYCATAVMRYRKYKKPISMLIHTSQVQNDHNNIAKALQLFVNKYSTSEWVKICKETYKKETKFMTKEDFSLDFEGYPFEIKDYPEFNKITDEIGRLKDELSHIKLGDDSQLDYHKGIHLCIDNCSNNGINDDMHVRLAYPNPNIENYPSPAPAFIIIGGNTLSRGLTIEGLVSTYFLRTTKMADTLMQMGRWFGYRRGYELLPRIWMTKDTKEKFKFLSVLDEELRETLSEFSFYGDDPKHYGPKVKNTPKVSWMMLSAKNRIQSAVATNIDFSGTTSQTTMFNNIEKELQHNIDLTESFFKELVTPNISRQKRGVYWENVNFESIKNYLLNFNFNQKSRTFKQIDKICEWYEKNFNEAHLTGWNVLVSGIGSIDANEGNRWEVNGYSIQKVNRSRLGKSTEQDLNFINIGVLRAPKDPFEDINESKLNLLNDKDKTLNSNSKLYIQEIRRKVGLGKTPQLTIYRINKDSEPDDYTKRSSLKAEADIIGLNLYIPGQSNSKSGGFATSLRIEINEPELNYEETEGGE